MHQFLSVAVIGDVAVLAVLVERLGVVEFVVRFVGKLIGAAVCFGVECGHHANATNLVLGVHVVTLIAKRSEIHTGRSTHAIDKGKNRLTFGACILNGLLVIVLGPS